MRVEAHFNDGTKPMIMEPYRIIVHVDDDTWFEIHLMRVNEYDVLRMIKSTTSLRHSVVITPTNPSVIQVR